MLALAADDLPANPVAITSIIGIDKESGDCMLAEGLKKILRIRARTKRSPASGLAFIEGLQHRVLLFSHQAGEFGSAREHLFHSRLQFG